MRTANSALQNTIDSKLTEKNDPITVQVVEEQAAVISKIHTGFPQWTILKYQLCNTQMVRQIITRQELKVN